MEITNLNILKDKRSNCYSVMGNVKLGDYLDFIEDAYKNTAGGLEGQREPLKTKTAIEIRKRMIKDIQKGSIFPPLVMGLKVASENFSDIENMDQEKFNAFLKAIEKEDVMIIDGMQRSTALIKAKENAHESGDDISGNNLRVEFWIAKEINDLIYRMLVLNTGQVPWNLKQQIEVLFRTIITEIKQKVDKVDIIAKKRVKGGQYKQDKVIELFLVFGARKETVNLGDRLTEEFTKLDFIESTEDKNLTDLFYKALNLLGGIDRAFSKYKPAREGKKEEDEETFSNFYAGLDLFTSQPARVGFITAIAIKVMGYPSENKDITKQNTTWDEINNNANKFIKKLNTMNDDEIKDLLAFETLNEVMKGKIGKSRIGEAQRKFFLNAFEMLIKKEFELDTLAICWRAY
ncbi:hypothetical protein MCHI_002761 [Candidatus Magnetoovum chiemensis]|nr:hypothetical protein MCHI_002761 [Candidatus Magnetoovum chiemensis]